MENIPNAVYLIIFLALIVVCVTGILIRRSIRIARKKQALFEDRFSKNYDKYPYRRSKLH
jgi:hypothetical protein